MRALAAAVAVFMGVVVASGCASSGKRATTDINDGVARGCVSCRQHQVVQVARSSNRYFSIFPTVPGKRRCVVPLNTMALRAAYRGTCQTSVRINPVMQAPEFIVTFTEQWRRPICAPALAVGCLHPWLRHTWRVIEVGSTQTDAKLQINSTRSRGAKPPQDYN